MRTRILTLALVILLMGIAGVSASPAKPTSTGRHR
jgi:hypothetical protein